VLSTAAGAGEGDAPGETLVSALGEGVEVTAVPAVGEASFREVPTCVQALSSASASRSGSRRIDFRIFEPPCRVRGDVLRGENVRLKGPVCTY